MRFARKINRENGKQMKKSALRKIKDYHAYKLLYSEKIKQVLDELQKEWVREINIHVPRWAQVFSLYFPPKVYSMIFFTLWRRECFLKFQNEITKKPWPRWRKWINKFISSALFNFVKFVCHDWLLYCFRYPLRTWGTRKVITRDSHDKVTMKIFYWGQEVYSTTKEVKVL